MFDYLIIGTGIAGTGLAYFLPASAKIALIDMEDQAGYHTTGRSAAFYAETYGGVAIQPLTTASKSFLRSPPDGFGPVLGHRRGCLYPFGADQKDKATSLYAELKSVLPETQMLSAEEIKKRAPHLKNERIIGGILDHDCTDIEVASLHQGYIRHVRRKGASFLFGTQFMSAEYTGDHWVIQTNGDTLQAKTLVNAAGAWGDVVAERAGVPAIGLQPMRRSIAVVGSPRGLPFDPNWPLVIDIDEAFYFKPEGIGYLISPADETPSQPCDAQPEIEDLARGIEHFQEATGIPVKRIENKWAGLRTFAPDRKPVIGFDTTMPAFFWNVGQGGFGIQTSPAWSRTAAAVLEGAPLPQDLTDFGVDAVSYSPERFLYKKQFGQVNGIPGTAKTLGQ
ncbi:glycerol-3-phosphate dehydrogenase [Kordiimonas sediminis]|uniref:Glycerol-3-phosphate dehydrogenase n=1 Tax=Kordiimonas sediminis TaxID=1735581 RepID=A0A919E3V1_9PROT|nr:FAD-binding oxidoreductase [Kordiimonas sediminis]GHF11220.1 glycerol-3-phosphate dehydrogenase [Kordiimonas sediminis]